MKAHTHYYPNQTAAYAEDKVSSRFIFSYATTHNKSIRYLDIIYAFTHEHYDKRKTVFVKQLPMAYGAFAFPTWTYGNWI